MAHAPADFARYVAIDWSGAKGPRLPGIVAASCPAGNGPPALVPPPGGQISWSRGEIVRWLQEVGSAEQALIGFDFSFSAPYLDVGAYFPGTSFAPKTAPELWELVDHLCREDPDFYAGSLAHHPELRALFLRGAEKGSRHERRLRVTENACRDQRLGAAESMFHLVGASQVGLASFSGMRVLNCLFQKTERPVFSIWPFDQIKTDRSVFIEIYTRIFLSMALATRRKVKSLADLNAALAHFGSRPLPNQGFLLSDHATDALISAAGMRALAHRPEFWNPAGLSDKVRRTEGWTFGVL